jgi:hypothetical protein
MRDKIVSVYLNSIIVFHYIRISTHINVIYISKSLFFLSVSSHGSSRGKPAGTVKLTPYSDMTVRSAA